MRHQHPTRKNNQNAKDFKKQTPYMYRADPPQQQRMIYIFMIASTRELLRLEDNNKKRA
jgi:hypothetical protein